MKLRFYLLKCPTSSSGVVMEIPNFARVILDWTLIELKNQMSTFSFSNMLIEPPYLLPSWLYNVVSYAAE